jgi:hypothetical protein
MQRKKRKRLEWQNGEEITSTNKQTNKQIDVQINRQYTKTAQANELTDDDSTDRHNKNR